MYTREPLTMQQFASSVCECIRRKVHKRRSRCVIDAIAFPIPHHQQSSQAFCQEAVVWKCLIHPNILSLLGVTVAPFQLISDWMPGGDLPQYIRKYPHADRLGLVGVPLVVFISLSPSLSAIRCSQRPLLPPLLQCDSRGPQGSAWPF